MIFLVSSLIMEGLIVIAMRNYFDRNGCQKQINIKSTSRSKLQTSLLKLSKLSTSNWGKGNRLGK